MLVKKEAPLVQITQIQQRTNAVISLRALLNDLVLKVYEAGWETKLTPATRLMQGGSGCGWFAESVIPATSAADQSFGSCETQFDR